MKHTIAYRAGYIAAKKGRQLEKAISKYTPGTQHFNDYKEGFEAFRSEAG